MRYFLSFAFIFAGLASRVCAAQSENEWVREATIKAHSILQRAGQQSRNRQFYAIDQALTRSQTQWQNYGRDWTKCINAPKLKAYTQPGISVIHLCRHVFDSQLYSTEQLAEIIVHESVHLIGIRDECSATRWEVAAMKWSGYGVALESDYFASCGISSADRPNY